MYWPELIRQDPRLHHPSIFLGGYYTDFDSGKYDITDCAKELLTGLRVPDARLQRPVLDHQRIVFVCHSTGGIIVRYLLESEAQLFATKQIGLVLMASPSYGSKLANTLGGLASFYDNQLGRHLRWGNDLLQNLDDRFKDVLDRRTIPQLVGIEACENHFIIHRKFWPNRMKVVKKDSAGRYFAVRMLANTDHFSVVKPSSASHPAHLLLVDFWLRHYGPPLASDLRLLLESSKEEMRSRNLPYFTPALLVSLLHQGGVLTAALSAVRPGSATDLRQSFAYYLAHTLPPSESGGFENFDWYSRPYVRSAQQFAMKSGSSTVLESHLVSAVLHSSAKSVAQIRAHLGRQFDRLLDEVNREELHVRESPGIYRTLEEMRREPGTIWHPNDDRT